MAGLSEFISKKRSAEKQKGQVQSGSPSWKGKGQTDTCLLVPLFACSLCLLLPVAELLHLRSWESLPLPWGQCEIERVFLTPLHMGSPIRIQRRMPRCRWLHGGGYMWARFLHWRSGKLLGYQMSIQLLTQRYLVYLKCMGLRKASCTGDLSPFGDAAVGAEWYSAAILKQLNQAPELCWL